MNLRGSVYIAEVQFYVTFPELNKDFTFSSSTGIKASVGFGTLMCSCIVIGSSLGT